VIKLKCRIQVELICGTIVGVSNRALTLSINGVLDECTKTNG